MKTQTYLSVKTNCFTRNMRDVTRRRRWKNVTRRCRWADACEERERADQWKVSVKSVSYERLALVRGRCCVFDAYHSVEIEATPAEEEEEGKEHKGSQDSQEPHNHVIEPRAWESRVGEAI